MNINEIKSLVSDRLGIDIDKLNKLLDEIKQRYYNLIDDKTAIEILLKENNLSLEDLLKIKVEKLVSGMKVRNLILKIGRIIKEKNNLIILDAFDETGKIRVFIKGKIRLNKKIIKIKYGKVFRNRILTVFTYDKYVELLDEDFIKVEDSKYISETIFKVIDKRDNYIVLTENFGILYIPKEYNLEVGSIYYSKFYLEKPIKIIQYKKLETNNLL